MLNNFANLISVLKTLPYDYIGYKWNSIVSSFLEVIFGRLSLYRLRKQIHDIFQNAILTERYVISLLMSKTQDK